MAVTKIMPRHDAGYRSEAPGRRRFAKTFEMKKFLMMMMLTLWIAQGFAQQKMTIHGTSNLHDWETVVTEVNVSGKFVAENGALKSVDQLTVRVPVNKIKSEKGKTMDNKTYETLKSDKNPNITFTASKVTVTGSDIVANGTLNIAGKSNTVTVKGKWKSVGNNEIEISGEHNLKMTDYGMTPPTALLGTMKVGDPITLKFTVRTKA